LRVLLVAGAPTRDYQFVRNLFVREQDKERATVCIYIQPPPGRTEPRTGIVQDVPPDRLLKAFPGETAGEARDEEGTFYNLGSYDLIVAFDFDWGQLSAKQVRLLEQWVGRRGGLVVVAGPMYTGRLARPKDEDKLKPLVTMLPVEPAGEADVKERDT